MGCALRTAVPEYSRSYTVDACSKLTVRLSLLEFMCVFPCFINIQRAQLDGSCVSPAVEVYSENFSISQEVVRYLGEGAVS